MLAVLMMFAGFVLFFIAMIVVMSVKVDLSAKPKSVPVAHSPSRRQRKNNYCFDDKINGVSDVGQDYSFKFDDGVEGISLSNDLINEPGRT